jgi:hypothetical protein
MCVYSACKLGEERAPSRNPATAPRDMYRAIGGNMVLSCKGQRYRAKGIVVKTSRLMQCECALYEGE